MNKAFNKFTWQNEPSVDTPLSAENLMKLNNALDTVDSRVVTMDTTKLDKVTANTMVKDISLDEATGIFTVTKLNGSTFQIDTKLEKIIVNFRFDKVAQKLVIIQDDGTEQEVDLSALITQYEFKESETIILSVDNDGNVYGTIKNGSITGDMLEPNYLANVTEKADTATIKAQEAENSAAAAKESETNAKASEATVKQAETNAISSANKAESYAVGGTGTRDGEDTDNAKYYSQNASSNAQSALSSANTAAEKASEATTSATKAKDSESIAVESATSAENSANTAAEKASEATASATASEASAVRAEEAAEKAESIVGFNIDDTLSETSVNPVQNKVITKVVNDIVSGDKTVGNANKLGGKGTEEYTTYVFEELNTSVLEKTLSLPVPSMRVYKLNNDAYTGNDLPDNNIYMYSDAICFKHGTNTATVILTGYGKDAKRLAINYCVNGTWQGWDTNVITSDLANYLPLSGGEIAKNDSTPLTVKNLSGEGAAWIGFKNSQKTIGYLGIDKSGVDAMFINSSGIYNTIFHTGNSYRVVKDTTAPSDTTCVWIDTATKTIKIYIDGAWTAVKEVEETGAGYHNSVYRGRYLGTSVTAAQWAAIKSGTFDDLYVGDYWIINGITWRIAGFDFYLNCGDTPCTAHHVVIVPDQSLYSAQMNNTESGGYVAGDPANTTAGGYAGSDMRTQNLEKAKTIISAAFGAEHILKHRRLLSNAVVNGYTAGHAWYDSTVELMTERNVYGNSIFSNFLNGTNHAYNYTIDKSQFPLFTFRPDLINPGRYWYWLMDVATASRFANVGGGGRASCGDASHAGGVRPDFSIYQS